MTIQKWYYFFVIMTILALAEIFSPTLLKSYISLPTDIGITSYVIAIVFSYVFGSGIAGAVAVICHMALAFWFIWPIAAYYSHKKLEKQKEKTVKK